MQIYRLNIFDLSFFCIILQNSDWKLFLIIQDLPNNKILDFSKWKALAELNQSAVSTVIGRC